MKRNDWILLISVFLYSYLFYEQSAGLNFLLFNLAIIIMLLVRNKDLLQSKAWITVAVCTLFSSFFIFFYSSALAITANLFSLVILSAISISPKTSFISGIILTVCSVSTSFVFIFLDWVERKSKKTLGDYHRPIYVKFFLVLIPLAIALLFFAIYRSANPLFYELTKDINLDWISFGWILFTTGGLLLLYGFYYNRRINAIINADENTPLLLSEDYVTHKGFLNKIMRTDTENISGLILFSLLNGLLATINFLDLKYLWLDGTLPHGIKHKEFVHDGVGMLITSLILAILILLFYFRGGLNFYPQNKWIKGMAFAWIVQNAFMIFSTAYRNNMYIQESGLSYKKIGVYIYLLLVLIGLTTTYIKVQKQKSNWYLFCTNTALHFFLLVFFCSLNWDTIIINYNISKYTAEGKKLEKYYLLDLSFKNLPQLLSLPDTVASQDDWEARDYYYYLRGTYFTDFKSNLHKKLYDFIKTMQENAWQSACIEKNRVYKELSAMSNSIKEINLNGHRIKNLKPLELFSNLEKISLIKCGIRDLKELASFNHLRNLDLRGNFLTSLKNFPQLKNLQILNISENNIDDFSPLYNLKNLKEVIVGSVRHDQVEKLKANLPNTKINTGTEPN